MKEIKEILEKLKENISIVSVEEEHLLLDYITNLQDYKQRNKKAIEYINHEIFKRTILVGVSTKKYTRNILDNVLNILKGDNND